jgi:outer membrane lipoprotein-sorting protein
MTTLLALTTLAIGIADPSIDDIVQKNLHDASFLAKIDMMSQKELVKIKKDFGTSYRIKETKFWIKDPHKIRAEAKVQDTQVIYVVNGPKRYAKVPRTGFVFTENNDDAPGKRQTFLDFGVMTSSMFSDPFEAKFVRTDRATGDYVFDITYNDKKYNDTSRHRVWVDPQKRYTTKREWYSQGGKQLAIFYYENVVNQDGVWMPTKVTVKNVEGKVGGITSYANLKVNEGIDESLFKIK